MNGPKGQCPDNVPPSNRRNYVGFFFQPLRNSKPHNVRIRFPAPSPSGIKIVWPVFRDLPALLYVKGYFYGGVFFLPLSVRSRKDAGSVSVGPSPGFASTFHLLAVESRKSDRL